MSYRLELGPVDAPTATFDASDLIDIDVAKPHTALADFDATVPYTRDLKDRVLDRARLYADSTLLFRGYLRDVQWDQERGTARLNGPGIADDLRDTAIERTFQNRATFDAIEDVWTNNTAFDATVRQPSPDEVVTDKVLVDADTTSELQTELPNITANDPVRVNNGVVEMLQSNFVLREANGGTGERADDRASGEVINDSGDVQFPYFGGDFGKNGDEIKESFTLNYDIPDGEVYWYFRFLDIDNTGDGFVDDLPNLEVRIDGNTVFTFGDRWSAAADDAWGYQNRDAGIGGLSAGTHTMSVVQVDDSDSTYDELGIDIFGVYDDRFSYNFDNTVSNSGDGTTGTYNYLDGPELYPPSTTVQGRTLDPQFNVVGATVNTTGWPDTSGNQSVAVSIDGGSTYTTATNATTVDVDDANNVAGTVDWRATLSRYSSGDERTPNDGDLGQSFDSVTVDYDGNDLSIVQDDTFRGSPFRILKDLHDKADYRFVVDHAATDGSGNLTKRVESFPRGSETRPKDWTVVNRTPNISFDRYANVVTIYGGLQADGTRPKVQVQEDSEVNEYGEESFSEIRPDLTTLDQVRSEAIDTLAARVTERELGGEVEALPTDILPGYSYPVDWFDDGNPADTPMERVQISESADSLRASLRFDRTPGITEAVIQQRTDIDRTREGI